MEEHPVMVIARRRVQARRARRIKEEGEKNAGGENTDGPVPGVNGCGDGELKV